MSSERGPDPRRATTGAARMVDVSAKEVTARQASARGPRPGLAAAVVELLRASDVPKGDALAVARIAGIRAPSAPPT